MFEQHQFPGTSGGDANNKGILLDNSSQDIEMIDPKSAGPIDWISKLPNSLVAQILSLLSITEACRTTVLSKHWQHLWTGIDNLIYDYDDLDDLSVHKFISLTDTVLSLFSSSNIKKFSLNFVFDYDEGLSFTKTIDKWLEFAVNKEVKDLYLNIWYVVDAEADDQPYNLPQFLCSSSSIVNLDCSNCRISEDCVLNWKSLKSLTLGYLCLRDEHIKQIMSNCPKLESFKLCSFCGLNRLHMTSPTCTQLQLIDHYHPDWVSFEGDCSLEIVAPYVQHLTISGDFEHAEIRVRDMSSLVHAYLTFYQDEYDVVDEDMVKDLLVSVRRATELKVSSWFMKVISDFVFEEENISLPLLKCRWLMISSLITKYSFSGLDNLLRSSPNLETLMISPDMPCNQCAPYEDVDLSGSNYLSLQENIFKVSLQNLKNVKVITPFCSYMHRVDATMFLQFLMFLLEHAINLEKMVIVPEHKECNKCSTYISILMKHLLAFPRTSNSSVISQAQGSVVQHNSFSMI